MCFGENVVLDYLLNMLTIICNLLFPISNVIEKMKYWNKVFIHENMGVSRICFGGNNILFMNVVLMYSVVGRGSYIGAHFSIMNANISNIANNIQIGSGNHPTSTLFLYSIII